MIIPDKTWEKIRGQFTDQEKAALSNAVNGQIICPKGASINTEAIEIDLLNKLRTAIGGRAD